MGQQAETNSLGSLVLEYPHEGRLHNPARMATFLRSTFTQKIPISTPTPLWYKVWVTTVCLLK